MTSFALFSVFKFNLYKLELNKFGLLNFFASLPFLV